MGRGLQRLRQTDPKHTVTSIIFFVYLISVFLTTIWVIHNGPTSALPGISLETATIEELRDQGVSFGLTYGEPNMMFFNQLNLRMMFTTVLISGLFSAIFLAGLELKSSVNRGLYWWESILIAVLMSVLYIMLFIILLISLPKLNYITISGEYISVENGIIRVASTFWLLLLMHSLIIGSIGAIWSRPILPSTPFPWTQPTPQMIQVNMGNWKQYSNWIVTMYGGTLITIAAIYTVEVRQAGTPFFAHAAVILGGGLFIILLFILFKIWECEQALGSPFNTLRAK